MRFLPGVRHLNSVNGKLESNSPTSEIKLHAREKVVASLSGEVDINDIRRK